MAETDSVRFEDEAKDDMSRLRVSRVTWAGGQRNVAFAPRKYFRGAKGDKQTRRASTLATRNWNLRLNHARRTIPEYP